MRHGWWLLPAATLLVALLGLAPTHADEGLPAVVARYVVRRPGHAPEQLVLVRARDRVEHRFVERGTSELWRRDARGELEHEKVFPRDGKSVHYTPGDLRTIGAEPAWEALASLVGEAERGALKAAGTRRVLGGRSARVLRGTLRGAPAELTWLEDVALPARLATGRGAGRVVLQLQALEACLPALCAEPDLTALRSIEFADLGDMEYDPFVRRFLAHEAHGHAH